MHYPNLGSRRRLVRSTHGKQKEKLNDENYFTNVSARQIILNRTNFKESKLKKRALKSIKVPRQQSRGPRLDLSSPKERESIVKCEKSRVRKGRKGCMSKPRRDPLTAGISNGGAHRENSSMHQTAASSGRKVLERKSKPKRRGPRVSSSWRWPEKKPAAGVDNFEYPMIVKPEPHFDGADSTR
eukprot:jgi/Bigna1/134664/aug1.26_g9372